MKDKITISYILVTVVLFGFILVYFANIDFKENNSRIENKSVEIFKRGKHYSEKLYDMVAHTIEFEKKDVIVEKSITDKNISSKDKNKKFVFSTKIDKKINVKPLVIKIKKKRNLNSKLVVINDVEDINKTVLIKDKK